MNVHKALMHIYNQEVRIKSKRVSCLIHSRKLAALQVHTLFRKCIEYLSTTLLLTSSLCQSPLWSLVRMPHLGLQSAVESYAKEAAQVLFLR